MKTYYLSVFSRANSFLLILLLNITIFAQTQSQESQNKERLVPIKQQLAEIGQNPPTVYRRIGNYNAFIFDTTDAGAANALLDGIKYEKNVQWLGEDPFLLKRAERAIVVGLSELFVATTLAIVGGLVLSILAGIAAGFIFFRFREQKRAGMNAFSDAGGMTRLNLDGFTSQVSSDRLLK